VEDLQQKLLDMEHELEVSQRSYTSAAARETRTERDLYAGHNSGAWPESDSFRDDAMTSLGGEDAFQMLELQNTNLQVVV